MATDKTLIEKREELKQRLAAGEYKTLVDVFLEWFDRLSWKVTRQSKPLPVWLIAIILILFVNLTGYAVNSIAGDWNNTFNYFKLLGIKYLTGILWKFWDTVLAVTVLIVINGYIGRIFALWQSDMLDATESVVSLNNFENWLDRICNRQLNLILAIIGGGSAYFVSRNIVSSVNVQSTFIGNGFALMQILNYIINFSTFYLFVMFIVLAAELRQYDIKLFLADPSSSELLSHLSGVLSLIVYIVAVFAAISTPVSTLIGLTTADTFVLLLIWAPIVAMFLLNQTSLSSIVRRAKWKTLNEIQTKVEKLQKAKNFETQANLETINRLLDYHNRIKGTRNSSLNLRSIFSFINSLLLPLLAFLLGNLDTVSSLFARKP